MQRRVDKINEIVARIINEQDAIIPFSPITYTHPFAKKCLDVDWYQWDLEFLRRCDAILIITLPGFMTSKGVQIEKNDCQKRGVPIFYATPADVVERCREIGQYLLNEKEAS